MVLWYYQNKRGDYFEIYELYPEDTASQFFKKRFLVYPTNQNRETQTDNEICRFDFIIERVRLREFNDELLEKISFRWGASIIAKELEKKEPRINFKHTPYEFDFKIHDWFLKFQKLCSYRKKEKDLFTCSERDKKDSTNEHIKEITCEECSVPDDFQRCKYLLPQTSISTLSITPQRMYISKMDCRLGKEITELLDCVYCKAREPIFLTMNSLLIESTVDEIEEVKEVKMDDIEEMKKKRFQFLKRLFDLTNGDEHQHVKMYDIGEHLNFDKDIVKSIEDYLEGEGLVKWQGTGGYTSITHQGVVEVERALTEPEEPTEHFPSNINIISAQYVKGVQIMQDSPGAKQVVSITKDNLVKVNNFIQQLKESIDKLNLEEQQENDLNAEIKTIESQMASSKPKTSVIADCFGSVKEILKTAATSALTTELLQKAEQVYQLLSG